ncbi:hypothetical protein F2P81_000752 [Scophthalmus maximus]|uniref:Uncharacterized protein n=1 Tax=Scophthalmus maximus TaxID=52904 RepID=A0A6A4TQF6_SCOMX|nr:hypothetical protein F2P81_000752 [Scophthalmus maximus]
MVLLTSLDWSKRFNATIQKRSKNKKKMGVEEKAVRRERSQSVILFYYLVPQQKKVVRGERRVISVTVLV